MPNLVNPKTAFLMNRISVDKEGERELFTSALDFLNVAYQGRGVDVRDFDITWNYYGDHDYAFIVHVETLVSDGEWEGTEEAKPARWHEVSNDEIVLELNRWALSNGVTEIRDKHIVCDMSEYVPPPVVEDRGYQWNSLYKAVKGGGDDGSGIEKKDDDEDDTVSV